MIIVTDLTEETTYTAKEISEVPDIDREMVQTAIRLGTSISQGKTVVENKERVSFFARGGRTFLDVHDRDYTFGDYYKSKEGFEASSWYFHLGHGVACNIQQSTFETEDEARAWLVKQYQINAWQI